MRAICLVTLLLVAARAVADIGTAKMTGDECRSTWGTIATLIGPQDTGKKIGDGPFVADDGACEMRDLGVDKAGARRLRWRAEGAQAVTQGQMPVAAEFDLLDIYLGDGPAKAGGGGWFKVAKTRVDGGASFRWDAASQTMEIGQFYLTTGAGNRIALRADVAGLREGDLETLGPRLLTAKVTALDISLDSTDLAAFVAALPKRNPPDAKATTAHPPPDPVTSAQTLLAAALPDLPPGVVDAESAAAL
ncbi:hypothetical protein [Fuscibacter oryzae]|uniref:Uncharacterized protein n=1 Tax=Fuscibacter oryzae TaxID=2803939 RepID=A0A8J7MTI4_9RHOB|nr:hypothetical protein [Fuscibacter oryzae]MBL4928705.1 hypothetical protein [Fuscibacter oryzae]